MTIRLSISSLAGTARTVVAVGTLRLRSMFVAMALAGPRRTVTLSSSVWLFGADFGSWAGIGALLVSGFEAAAASAAEGRPLAAGAASAAGSLATGGRPDCWAAAGDSPEALGAACSLFTTGSWRVGGFDSCFEAAAVPFPPAEDEPPPSACPSSSLKESKMLHHFLSTEFRSFRNCSYSSSTSHSLPPNSSGRRWLNWFGTGYTPLP